MAAAAQSEVPTGPTQDPKSDRIRRAATRRDPAVRSIIRSWRHLTSPTGGRGPGGEGCPTVVACSGGADSSALAIALAATGARIVLAHIVHDMRPAAESHADRDRTRELAQRLGVEFAEASIKIKAEPGNAEAAARRKRYAALARIARAHDLYFVATGHHAGDQAESVLMGLLRGSGPRGLSGVATRRQLGRDGVVFVRPMLDVTHEDAQRICREAGWEWAEDATNADTTRLRAAIRLGVLPALAGLATRARAQLERRIARSATLLADAAGLIDDAVDRLWKARSQPDLVDELAWPRPVLSNERPIVLGALLRRASAHLAQAKNLDRAGKRVLDPCIHAIRDTSTEPRIFTFASIQVRVTANHVQISRNPQ